MKILIVIDMQNDFITGSLATNEAQAILPKVIKRVEESKEEKILFTLDTHDTDYLNTPEGKKLPVIHCQKDTDGWQIEADILNAWQNNEKTQKNSDLTQHFYEKSVFGSVELVNDMLKLGDEITEIELIGVCTDICVTSNAIMLKNNLPHIPIVVNSELCAGVTPESHDAALVVMKSCQIDVI